MSKITPLSALWFWRGLNGHSVTFAALFASVLLGFSISSGVHHILTGLGFHWLYVIVIPILLFKVLAAAEVRWIPDRVRRRSIALTLLLGSIALSSAIGWIRTHAKHDSVEIGNNAAASH